MKKFILILSFITLSYAESNAKKVQLSQQTILASEVIAGTECRLDNNFNLSDAAADDTILFPIILEDDIDPTTDSNDPDTLFITRIDMRFTATHTFVGDIRISSTYGQEKTVSLDSGAGSQNNKIVNMKFVEGKEDTIIYVVDVVTTDGKIAGDYIDLKTFSVISNTNENLFTNSNTIISNPVSESLYIDLNGSNASLELISLEGNKVATFEVNGIHKEDVSMLSKGLYILKQVNTTNYKKILIH